MSPSPDISSKKAIPETWAHFTPAALLASIYRRIRVIEAEFHGSFTRGKLFLFRDAMCWVRATCILTVFVRAIAALFWTIFRGKYFGVSSRLAAHKLKFPASTESLLGAFSSFTLGR